QRLGELVEGLLALARADAGAERAETIDVVALARARAEHWHALAEERAITRSTDAPESAVLVRAAPERVVQVLDNLLANALHAGPHGSDVVVTVHAGRPWVELRVR